MVLSHMLGLPTGKVSACPLGPIFPSLPPAEVIVLSPSLQAPELLLPKAASLRQDLLFFQDQWSLRCWDQLHMKTSLPPGPSTQGRSALLPCLAFLPIPRTINLQN